MRLRKFIVGFMAFPAAIVLVFATIVLPLLLFGEDTGLLIITGIYVLGFSVCFGFLYSKE